MTGLKNFTQNREAPPTYIRYRTYYARSRPTISATEEFILMTNFGFTTEPIGILPIITTADLTGIFPIIWNIW